jgi:hypothetical protein
MCFISLSQCFYLQAIFSLFCAKGLYGSGLTFFLHFSINFHSMFAAAAVNQALQQFFFKKIRDEVF